jgi:hypothetical protein
LRNLTETIGTRGNTANNALVAPVTGAGILLMNQYEPIADHGNGTNERDNERLSFNSLSRASGTHSSAMNNMGRELNLLTPEILHLLDILEPDTGKQTRLLTEHLTG